VSMTLAYSIPIACVALLAFSYFVVRRLTNAWMRGGLALSMTTLLIFLGCKDLESGSVVSMMTCSLLWMLSIRLVHQVMLPHEARSHLKLTDYTLGFLWFFLPISRRKAAEGGDHLARSRPAWLLDTATLAVGALAKQSIAAMSEEWLVGCLEGVEGGGNALRSDYWLTLQFMLIWAVNLFSMTFVQDMQMALVSLLSLDRYEMLPFNDWAITSTSLREFWGRRYNRLVSTLLHQSVFTPLKEQPGLSSAGAAMAAFLVSGLLHMHVAVVTFSASPFPALMFFVLNGVGCYLEARLKLDKRLPAPVGMLLTHAVLLGLSPLYPALFVYAGPQFYHDNPSGTQPLVRLPVPPLCPHKIV